LRSQLHQISQLDLTTISQELIARARDSVLSQQPYYEIVDFRVFQGDTARKYAAYGKVHFYYLKGIKLYQSRKYRFNTISGHWERFDIKLKHQYNQIGKSIKSPQTAQTAETP
jgi:hypothetical protein